MNKMKDRTPQTYRTRWTIKTKSNITSIIHASYNSIHIRVHSNTYIMIYYIELLVVYSKLIAPRQAYHCVWFGMNCIEIKFYITYRSNLVSITYKLCESFVPPASHCFQHLGCKIISVEIWSNRIYARLLSSIIFNRPRLLSVPFRGPLGNHINKIKGLLPCNVEGRHFRS